MSTDGHLIVHPENTLKEHEAYFNEAYSDVNSDTHLAAISMKTGHAGHSEMHVDGKPNFIFYHPLENA